jgi:hypothetical protein
MVSHEEDRVIKRELARITRENVCLLSLSTLLWIELQNLKCEHKPGMVAYIYNPNFLGGRDQENCSYRDYCSAWEKNSTRLHFNKQAGEGSMQWNLSCVVGIGQRIVV